MSIKKLTALFALLALAACDVEKEELETLTLELNASAEDIDYGTTVTLSWSSNASQCYTSGAYWSGERPTTGSEDFDIKRGGPAVFIMECRRNNEFINQAVEINVNKTLANNFIFDVQGEVDFTVDYPAGTQPRVTGLTRGDFNDDNIADTFIGVEYRDIATEALIDVGFYQITGGAIPVVLEVDAQGCQGTYQLVSTDYDSDGFSDVISSSSDQKRLTEQTHLCIFKGAGTGLAYDPEFITNETTLDLANPDVRFMILSDRNNDLVPDFYMLTGTNEYWIERGIEDAPKFEEFSYDNTTITDRTITAGTTIDFDSDSNVDIVLATVNANGDAEYVTVPRSGDGTNWNEAVVVSSVPFTKAMLPIDFDRDSTPDLLIMGDETAFDGFNTDATNTLKILESEETNLFDIQTDITFTKQGTASLNRHILNLDFDVDFDGGDLLFTFDEFGDITANFLIAEKQEVTNDDDSTSYEFVTVDDEELGIANFDYDNAYVIWTDLNLDFDVDAIVIDHLADTNQLNFYIRQNQSN